MYKIIPSHVVVLYLGFHLSRNIPQGSQITPTHYVLQVPSIHYVLFTLYTIVLFTLYHCTFHTVPLYFLHCVPLYFLHCAFAFITPKVYLRKSMNSSSSALCFGNSCMPSGEPYTAGLSILLEILGLGVGPYH